MSRNKTDMLTVEQFNSTQNKKSSNCLGFAIGVPEAPELDYIRIGIGDSFAKKLSEYGMIVREVESLEELRGKTGFIVYGFYDTIDWFTRERIRNDFHVVRVNPDGTLVHKQDAMEPAKPVELLDSDGRIEEYEDDKKYIHIFSLEEERNMDKKAIMKRARLTFSQLEMLITNPGVSAAEKDGLKAGMINLQAFLEGQSEATLNSNDINRIIERIALLAKKHHIEKDEQR